MKLSHTLLCLNDLGDGAARWSLFGPVRRVHGPGDFVSVKGEIRFQPHGHRYTYFVHCKAMWPDLPVRS